MMNYHELRGVIMDTNIQKYQAFVETVESGSFTEAARKLNYTQSGISRMIADLEKEWNITLLERKKNGLRLTSDGLSLLPYARKLCEEYQRLQMQVDGLNGLETGFIRIGTISSIATHWLPNIIKAFQSDYPGVDYELLIGDYSEIESWIQEGRVDCGFLILPVVKDIEYIELERDELKVIMPEGHPLAEFESIPIDRLTEDPFMLLSRGERSEISELFDSYGISPNTHLTLWDDYAVMSMVEKGLGISILPDLILKRIPYKIEIRSLDVPAYRDIVIAFRSRDTISLAVNQFLNYLHYRLAEN